MGFVCRKEGSIDDCSHKNYLNLNDDKISKKSYRGEGNGERFLLHLVQYGVRKSMASGFYA
jgi:hypothetical protein